MSTGSGVVTLNLHTLVSQLAATLGISSQVAALQSKLQGSSGASARAAAQQKLGITLPPANGQLVIMRSNQLGTAQDIANAVKNLAIVLPAIAILLFALAVYLARGRRRRTLRTAGWCFVLIGVVLLLIRRIGGDAVVNGLVKVPSNKPAVHDVWNIGTSLLYSIAVAMIVYGIVIVAAAWLAGPTRPATAIRKVLAPSLRESPAVAYSVVGAVLLLVVLWGPTPAFRNIWWILVFAVLLALGVTMLRRETAREFPEIEHGQALHDFQAQRAQARARKTASHRLSATGTSGERADRTRARPQHRARRDPRATSRAPRPRRDHQRRVPGREDTGHEQWNLTTHSTPRRDCKPDPMVAEDTAAETSPDAVEPPRSIRARIGHTLSGWRQLGRIAYRDPEHVAERLTLYSAGNLGEPSLEWAHAFARRARTPRAR